MYVTLSISLILESPGLPGLSSQMLAMKKVAIPILPVILIALNFGLLAQATQPTDHAILVSMDGFWPDFSLEEKYEIRNRKSER